MRTTIPILIALLLAGCSPGPEPYAIRGRILGADGRPVVQSDIQLFSNEPTLPRPVLRAFRVAEDGGYAVPVEHAGFYFFRVCGVNHQPVEMPLYISNPKNVDLDITLKAVEYAQDPESVQLIGAFNNFSHREGGVEMTRGEDGVYRATVEAPADTFAYQILGIDVNGHSVNGTQADYYVPDVSGDYISVIRTKGEPTVDVELDVRGLDYPGGGGAIVFGENGKYEEAFAKIFTDVRNRRNDMWAAYRSHVRSGGGAEDFDYDYNRDTAILTRMWEEEDDPVLEEMRLWARVAYGKLDSTLAVRALERFGPAAPVWAVDPQLLTNLTAATGNDSLYLDFFIRMVDDHPDKTIKPYVLQHAMWVADGHDLDSLVLRLYERFARDFGDSNRKKSVDAAYSPDRNIQPGRPVPDFRVTSIDDPGQTVGRSSLMGRVYLIDFWATWCGPCVGEMEHLHDAHDRYGHRGLEIVSVSFDRGVEEVERFRGDKWPMPWFNAHETWTKDGQLVRDFELVSIPKPILVGRDGRIIAAGTDLRGNKLAKTLAAVFDG